MDLGWAICVLFLLFLMLLVTLLIMPMPNNAARGAKHTSMHAQATETRAEIGHP